MEYKLKPGLLELMVGITLLKIDDAEGVGVKKGQNEERSKRKNLVKGIKAQIVDDTIHIELDITVSYEKNLIEVAEKVREEVASALKRITGLNVEEVNVNVVGVNAV